MKIMLLAFVTIVFVAVVAYYGLHAAGFSTDASTASQSVRLSH
jgi:hypothetical protein